jgi:hypothetical protein
MENDERWLMNTNVAETKTRYTVDVEYDPEAGKYVAECLEIGLLTEAGTMDDLVLLCRKAGADIARDFGVTLDPADLLFSFHRVEQPA